MGRRRGTGDVSFRDIEFMQIPVISKTQQRLVQIPLGPVILEGSLILPVGARGIVLFAHGSGSSRHSPRNHHVARQLHEAKLATLLTDLLTPDEEAADTLTAHLRFNIKLLAERVMGITYWIKQQPD